MGAKKILLIGMATGTLVGLLMTVISHIPLGTTSDGNKITVMYHWSGALMTLIGIPLVSAFSVKYGSKKLNDYEPSLKHLLPVAVLTCLPVLSSAAGAPNNGFGVLAALILIGVIFGVIWSMPFVLWDHFRSRRSDSD